MSRHDPDLCSTPTLLAHALRKNHLFSQPRGDFSALEEPIALLQQAVDGSSVDDANRAEWLISLAFALSLRRDATESDSDTREASRLAYEAGDATRCDGNFLQAIHVAREVVDLTSGGDKGRAVRLSNLGGVCAESYNKTGNRERLQEATRIGRDCLTTTPDDHPDKALRYFNLADRLQLRCFKSQSTIDLEEIISLYRLTLHEFRASMSLRVEVGYSLMQACVSKGKLNDAYETGAETIDRLSLFRPFSLQKTDVQREASKLLGLGTEKASLAWKPEDEARMRSAAALGPVIVVNVSPHACDGIIIQRDGFSAIPLPNLDKSDIDSKYHSLGRSSLKVLEWLLDAVAEPILDALGFTEPPREREIKRVWWVLTGSLSIFPIHAAGRHSQRNGETPMDRVMSSYATSVSAIAQSRRTAPVSHNDALLLSAGETPGHRRMKLKPVGLEPITERVLSHQQRCKIFHFAGHGYTGTKDPSESQLYLKGWETYPLTVASLLELNLHQKVPSLRIYLPPVQDRSKAKSSSMKEVNDQSCVDMAAMIYEEVLRGDMSDESVRRGVHVVMKAKRVQWLVETYGADKAINVGENTPGEERREVNVERDTISLDDDDEQGIPGVGNAPLH
ncbi:hypothetical protein FCOIX_742 [Fusarium coicis]|nr:hypothetical protein FCOIX_742 [Fusarium coicis]